jgi:hypothetical protein
MKPKRSELPLIYGEIVDGKWEDEAHHMCSLVVPALLRTQIGHEKIYCNEDLRPALAAAFDNLIDRDLAAQLKSFDGCFCIRPSRVDAKPSVHSWGMGIDVNATDNPLGHVPTLTPEFVACFEDAGFVWGGRWHKADGMHFQFVEEA